MAKRALEEKAEQLALTSKYKSEFLANMSHELRTPLNSLLILSKLLSDNPNGNLNDKQIEFARTIHAAGSDLLALINDILDLSKIESGTVSIEVGDVPLRDLLDHTERSFRQVAWNKRLTFDIAVHADAPDVIRTDEKRLQQVINNLLANAFKFTEAGGVTLRVQPATEGWNRNNAILNSAAKVVAFAVTDTGIGVAEDKQRIIFEAFQQADGTTSRKYGGTGLGLSISREITQRLGGDIRVSSTPGEGSTFTLYLPSRFEPVAKANGGALPPAAVVERFAQAARDETAEDGQDGAETAGGTTVLIVEPDAAAAQPMMALAREHGFHPVPVQTGNGALSLARRLKPAAILVDLHLPDIDGVAFLEMIKNDLDLRHIAVHAIGPDESRRRCREAGALGVSTVPADARTLAAAFTALRAAVTRDVRHLLLVENDAAHRADLLAALAGPDLRVAEAGTVREAQRLLAGEAFDGVIVSTGLPRNAAVGLVERIRDTQPAVPVVLHLRKPLADSAAQRLEALAQAVPVRQAATVDQVLDESCLLLHRPTAALPAEQRARLEELRRHQEALAGRTVLIVDDDIRNIFSMTSVLEQYRMNVLFAETGRDGIALLREGPPVDAVLVDVMMPEMDGYEVIREIRAQAAFRTLPIIAVTAKAMQGDRVKCLEAGASDYIAKPVEVDRLLATLRAWLRR